MRKAESISVNPIKQKLDFGNVKTSHSTYQTTEEDKFLKKLDEENDKLDAELETILTERHTNSPQKLDLDYEKRKDRYRSSTKKDFKKDNGKLMTNNLLFGQSIDDRPSMTTQQYQIDENLQITNQNFSTTFQGYQRVNAKKVYQNTLQENLQHRNSKEVSPPKVIEQSPYNLRQQIASPNRYLQELEQLQLDKQNLKRTMEVLEGTNSIKTRKIKKLEEQLGRFQKSQTENIANSQVISRLKKQTAQHHHERESLKERHFESQKTIEELQLKIDQGQHYSNQLQEINLEIVEKMETYERTHSSHKKDLSTRLQKSTQLVSEQEGKLQGKDAQIQELMQQVAHLQELVLVKDEQMKDMQLKGRIFSKETELLFYNYSNFMQLVRNKI